MLNFIRGVHSLRLANWHESAALRSILKRLGLTVVALLAAFLIAEVGLRLFAPRHYPVIPAAYEFDANTSYRLRPNSHLLTTTDFQQESIANQMGSANFLDDFKDYEYSRLYSRRLIYTRYWRSVRYVLSRATGPHSQRRRARLLRKEAWRGESRRGGIWRRTVGPKSSRLDQAIGTTRSNSCISDATMTLKTTWPSTTATAND